MGLIQKPYIGILPNRNHPLSQGLVGCWVMNEATGGKVFDLSGNGNDGTITGADWVAEGLDFVAVNSDYVEIASLNVTDLTLSLIVTPKTIVGSHSIVDGYGVLSYFQQEAGNLRIYNNGSTWLSNFFTDGVPVEITATFVGSTSDYKIYKNGILVHSETGGVHNDATLVYIGYGGLGSVDGTINYTFVHNRALSAGEVAWLYREPYAMFQYPSLVELFTDTGAPPATYIPALMNYYRQLRTR